MKKKTPTTVLSRLVADPCLQLFGLPIIESPDNYYVNKIDLCAIWIQGGIVKCDLIHVRTRNMRKNVSLLDYRPIFSDWSEKEIREYLSCGHRVVGVKFVDPLHYQSQVSARLSAVVAQPRTGREIWVLNFDPKIQ